MSNTARIADGIRDMDALFNEHEATLGKNAAKRFKRIREAFDSLADEACEATGIALEDVRDPSRPSY